MQANIGLAIISLSLASRRVDETKVNRDKGMEPVSTKAFETYGVCMEVLKVVSTANMWLVEHSQ